MTGLEYLQDLTDDQLSILFLDREELTINNIENLAKKPGTCRANWERLGCISRPKKDMCNKCSKQWLTEDDGA